MSGRANETDVATEHTPLLVTKAIAPIADLVASATPVTTNNNGQGASSDDNDEEDERPFPKWQVFWLCFARMLEPMAFFSIFPYINQMVRDNGHLDTADVGFYSGLIESLFSLTQALVMVFWGRAADTFGRKPVLVSSLAGVAIATSIFGMAKTIWQMILFRCIAGVFAGTIVTIRTMLTEVSTPSTQALAFSWFAFSGNIGIFLGPLLGGALADPAHQYPRLFGHVQFFLDYPYALASFVIAGVGVAGVVTSALFVQETLEKEPTDGPTAAAAAENENGNGNGNGTVAVAVGKPKEDKLSILDIIKSPGVGMVLYAYSHIMLLALAYTALVPIFWFTPIPLGGYGFAPYQISIMMAVNGASQAAWLLLVFPPLQHRFGTNAVLRGCSIAYPFFFMVCPLGNVLLRSGGTTAFWILAPPITAVGVGVSMSFTAIQLALNDVSPNAKVLGTLNSLALTAVSLLRSFAPALFTSLFAIGARTQLLWGYAIWVVMVLLALGFTILARYMPEEKNREKNGKAKAKANPVDGSQGRQQQHNEVVVGRREEESGN